MPSPPPKQKRVRLASLTPEELAKRKAKRTAYQTEKKRLARSVEKAKQSRRKGTNRSYVSQAEGIAHENKRREKAGEKTLDKRVVKGLKKSLARPKAAKAPNKPLTQSESESLEHFTARHYGGR